MGLIDQTSDTACVSFYKHGYIGGAARLAPMQINQTGRKIDGVRMVDSLFHPKTSSITGHLHRVGNRESGEILFIRLRFAKSIARNRIHFRIVVPEFVRRGIDSSCLIPSLFPFFTRDLCRHVSSRKTFATSPGRNSKRRKIVERSFRVLSSLSSSLPLSIPSLFFRPINDTLDIDFPRKLPLILPFSSPTFPEKNKNLPRKHISRHLFPRISMLNTSTCTIENSFFTIDVSLPLYYAREDRTDKMDRNLFRFLFSFSNLDPSLRRRYRRV